ncbi:MAG: hypothetical protein H6607_08135 [Flavobacteriales bacterium]|nr:hypothetical protein [Flavobacteriales bacterium]
MSKIDKKLEQLKLQHEISEILRNDNGVSCHFDYHVNMLSDDETIKLNLLTYNKRHNEYMLFHTEKGTSSIHCLSKIKKYIELGSERKKLQSFSIRWKKKNEPNYFTSYFSGMSKNEVVNKFLHEKDANDYDFEIIENPIS